MERVVCWCGYEEWLNKRKARGMRFSVKRDIHHEVIKGKKSGIYFHQVILLPKHMQPSPSKEEATYPQEELEPFRRRAGRSKKNDKPIRTYENTRKTKKTSEED